MLTVKQQQKRVVVQSGGNLKISLSLFVYLLPIPLHPSAVNSIMVSEAAAFRNIEGG